MYKALKYAKQLEEAGFSPKQVEAQIVIMSDLFESKIAMKEDLKALEQALRFEIKESVTQVKTELKMEMNGGFTSIRADMSRLELRLFKNLTLVISVVVGTATALATVAVKFF